MIIIICLVYIDFLQSFVRVAIREQIMTESEAIIAHWLSPEAISGDGASLSSAERRPRMLFAPDPVPMIIECSNTIKNMLYMF